LLLCTIITNNEANQFISDGTNTYDYDNNGNLASTNSIPTHTWNRANRLLSFGGATHVYDGEGHRVQQTVSSVVTKYLLDIQPSLAVVLSQDVGGSITRFVHAPRGIHARNDASNNWHWTGQDGLGTVRVETNNSTNVEGSQSLDPFGNSIDLSGTIGTPYGFTGELVDGSGLLDLRARRYSPTLGIFPSLDPFEGIPSRSMSLNGYLYVEGNVPNGAVGELLGLINGYSYANGNPVNYTVGELKTPPPDPLPIAMERGGKISQQAEPSNSPTASRM